MAQQTLNTAARRACCRACFDILLAWDVAKIRRRGGGALIAGIRHFANGGAIAGSNYRALTWMSRGFF